MADDRYASFDYSRLINWDQRLAREWPFLEETFRNAPSRKLLDLGSGTGEHARFLAAKGFEVTGVDSSPAMVEKSRAAAGDAAVKFFEGDMREAASLAGDGFGGALCLGNALPHLAAEDDLRRLATSARIALLPGAAFMVQLINYDRIEIKKERSLPLNFLPDPDDPKATIVFMRTMELLPGRRAIFMPATLRQRSDLDPPMELLTSRRVEIRTWRRDDLEKTFHESGFQSVDAFGSYGREPFDPGESRDLIVVAR